MGAEEGRRSRNLAKPLATGRSPPGVDSPAPSLQKVRTAGRDSQLCAPPPAPLPAAAPGWHLLSSFVGASRSIRSGTWDRREGSVRSGGGRSSPSAGTGLSKPSRPPWSPRPPSESPSRFRLPQPMHILTRERGARPETPSVKVCLLPGPHYIYPSSLPPSSFPDHIRPPSLTSRLIPSAFPTKLLALPAASPTASAGDLPSGVSAPARTSPGPGLDGREVSGYRGPLISFGTFPDWQEVENLNSCRPPAPGPAPPRAPRIPEGVQVISKEERRGREQSGCGTLNLRFPSSRGWEGAQRGLRGFAFAARSPPLTSAPVTSGDNSVPPESRRLLGSALRAPTLLAPRLSSHPSPWPNLRRWEKPTRGAGESQACRRDFSRRAANLGSPQ